MERDVLRKVQLTQLEIAKEIRRVCEENDIPYFLCDGTLLGAVRHGGFIPWDDDMDLGMLRKDYEQFCRIAPQKLGKAYMLQTWHTDPNYALPFAKIRKRGTLYLEAKSSRLEENGFFVDIFPFDYVPEKKEAQVKLCANLLGIFRVKLMKSGYTPWMENDRIIWKKRIGYLYYQMKAMLTSGEKLTLDFDALATQTGRTKILCEQSALPKPDYYATDWCESLTEMTFEGESFKAPAQYDAYLRSLYGDYMQLPPEDQRENRHQIVEMNFGD